MVHLIQLVNALCTDRRGAAALDYALLGGAIALILIGAVHTLGTAINGVSTDISGAIW